MRELGVNSTVRIVITADDFGIAGATSSVIVRLLRSGVLSSTSIMACVDGALDDAAKHRDVLNGRAGVHLQLSPSRFLSPANARRFVDLAARCRKRGNERREALALVEKEWRGQIEAVRKSIGSITHLDSHHGVHLEEPLLGVAEYLAEEYSVALRAPKGWNSGRVRQPVGEYTIGDWTLSGRSAAGLVLEVIGVLTGEPAPKSIEIVTHPGIADDELCDRSAVTTEREIEIVELFRLAVLLERAGLSREYASSAGEP
jgi:chitin disaccharide deacetylase